MKRVNLLLGIQATYYALTAIWALIHIKSFMAVTGPKTDIWIVKTFSLLLLAVCIGFFMALRRSEINVSVGIIAFSIAVLLLGAEVYYPIKGVTSYIYLVDASIQFIFACCWSGIFMRLSR